MLFLAIQINAQVGINTENPETTFEVVGKPNDVSHYDGILPPRISGDQLASKIYPFSKKGTIVFITEPATILIGQVIHVVESGYYFFNGNYWVQLQKEPLYYDALILLDDTLPANSITIQTNWSSLMPFTSNPRQYSYSYRVYRLGTSGLGISGQIDARRIGNVGFLDLNISCNTPFVPTGIKSTSLLIDKPLRDLGFMTDANASSLANIVIMGSSINDLNEIESGIVSLNLNSFELILWKNQMDKFYGKVKGIMTFPINYLNVIN
ncbi:hypothetical protein [Cloacibacterium normanense]|uniref:hypothetical protein n=1 Tax=Cloacibacterium normanense TaxID=237258 RepID=UPI00391880EA